MIVKLQKLVRYIYTNKVRYGKTLKAIAKEPAKSHILMTVQTKNCCYYFGKIQ